MDFIFPLGSCGNVTLTQQNIIDGFNGDPIILARLLELIVLNGGTTYHTPQELLVVAVGQMDDMLLNDLAFAIASEYEMRALAARVEADEFKESITQ